MDTSLLRNITIEFTSAKKKANFPGLIDGILNTYIMSVQNPNPDTEKNFKAAMKSLSDAVLKFSLNNFSKIESNILEAINGNTYYGEGLLNTVDDIFNTSRTPAEIQSRLKELHKEINAYYENMVLLNGSLSKLGIDRTSLSTDAANVEVCIPSTLVKNNIKDFSIELKRINAALSDVQEIYTNGRAPIEIKLLNTGSLEILITIDPVTAAGLISLTSSIIALITSVLNSRKSVDQLTKDDAPKETIEQLKKWEEQRISEGLEKIQNDLINNYKGDKGRKNELQNSLKITIPYLAEHIEKGMQLDVRIALPPSTVPSSDQETVAEADKLKSSSEIDKARELIRDNIGKIKTITSSGVPILKLPENINQIDSAENNKK